MSTPAFNEYPARFGSQRSVLLPSADKDFAYRPEELEAAMAKADILVLVNPDNPSGHFLGEAEVKGLVDRLLERGKKVIVDESFADFAESEKRFSLLDDAYLATRPGLLVIKSISKSYGVPGIRLGVLASGDTKLIRAVRKLLPVWNINSLGEAFLQIADKYKSEYRSACDKLAGERKRFAALLEATGKLAVYPSQANYLLCRLTDGTSSRQLAVKLLDEDRIFIKDLAGKSGFPEGGQFIRLAVRKREENDRLVAAIATQYRPSAARHGKAHLAEGPTEQSVHLVAPAAAAAGDDLVVDRRDRGGHRPPKLNVEIFVGNGAQMRPVQSGQRGGIAAKRPVISNAVEIGFQVHGAPLLAHAKITAQPRVA